MLSGFDGGPRIGHIDFLSTTYISSSRCHNQNTDDKLFLKPSVCAGISNVPPSICTTHTYTYALSYYLLIPTFQART